MTALRLGLLEAPDAPEVLRYCGMGRHSSSSDDGRRLARRPPRRRPPRREPDGARPMRSGWAVMGDTQFLPGYCVLLVRLDDADHLTDLPRDGSGPSSSPTWALLGEAVFAACNGLDPSFRRLNYEILGNAPLTCTPTYTPLRLGARGVSHRPGVALPSRVRGAPEHELAPEHDELREPSAANSSASWPRRTHRSDVTPTRVTVLDHIVFAVADLAAGIADIERRIGVRPALGGSHLGLGTANHLLGLRHGRYFEIIGPDPNQHEPAQPRPFGVDGLTGSRIVTWAIRPADFDGAITNAISRGYDPGPPRAMSRRTPDGTLLTWRMTPGAHDVMDGVVPFLIDWGDTAHPAMAAGLPTVALDGWEVRHPVPDRVRAAFAALDVDVPVMLADHPRLVATLRGPHGGFIVS